MDTYGLYGDRFCAFYDGTMEGWESFFTARDIPDMLAYKAKLVDDGVTVTSPDGRTFGWNEELLNEIQRYSKRKMSHWDMALGGFNLLQKSVPMINDDVRLDEGVKRLYLNDPFGNRLEFLEWL